MVPLFCVSCTGAEPQEVLVASTVHRLDASQGLAFSNRQSPRHRGLPQADFDGDGALDLTIVLGKGESSSAWLIDFSGNGFGAVDLRLEGLYGRPADVAVPANYGGDARADLAIYDSQGTWWIDLAEDGEKGGFNGWRAALSTAASTVGEPVPADYDHDGRTDLAVVGNDGTWRIDFYEVADDNGTNLGFAGWDLELSGYGGPGVYPLPADYDGDGWIDLAVRLDSGEWRIDHANRNVPLSPFGGFDRVLFGYGTGEAGVVAAAADFDGDGRADLSVRNAAGVWSVDLSMLNGSSGFDLQSVGWGGEGSQPLPGDYDGDGLSDLVVKEDCGAWRIDYARRDAAGRPIFAGVERSVGWATPSGTLLASTKAQLLAALRADFPAVIEVWPYSAIDLGADRGLPVPACARLTGGRNGLVPGARIYTADPTPGKLFVVTSDFVTIERLRIRGPGATAAVGGVAVKGARNFRFIGGEVSDFAHSAVSIDDERRRITRASGMALVQDSYLHHNQTQDLGYGVAVGDGAWAQIERNVFSWNRHGITHDGSAESGYLAYRNLFLEGVLMDGFDSLAHLDVHGSNPGSHHGGTAGEYFDIGWNTVRGDQEIVDIPFVDLLRRPAVNLRGHPTNRMDLHDNVFEHGSDHAVINCWFVFDTDVVECSRQINSTGNRTSTDHTTELGAGDFDNDGVADVFLGTGVTWWYSSGGRTEWRYLNTSGATATQLAFANVVGDSTTDVVMRTSDGNLRVSESGRGPFAVLTSSPVGVKQLHFADFNGDGRTDIFRTDGHQWWVWDGLTRVWWARAEANVPFGSLRFAALDAAPGADVIAVMDGDWKRNSSGGAGSWVLQNGIDDPLAGTVTADFNGDGTLDLARSGPGATWQWTRSFRGSFVQLRPQSIAYLSMATFLFGNFSGTARADALALELTPLPGRRFVISRGGAELPALYTNIDMR